MANLSVRRIHVISRDRRRRLSSCCRDTGLSVSMSGLPFTCPWLIDTGNVLLFQLGSPTESGEISTFRCASPRPVSTIR